MAGSFKKRFQSKPWTVVASVLPFLPVHESPTNVLTQSQSALAFQKSVTLHDITPELVEKYSARHKSSMDGLKWVRFHTDPTKSDGKERKQKISLLHWKRDLTGPINKLILLLSEEECESENALFVLKHIAELQRWLKERKGKGLQRLHRFHQSPIGISIVILMDDPTRKGETHMGTRVQMQRRTPLWVQEGVPNGVSIQMIDKTDLESLVAALESV
jgi:hypothetical protein